MIIQQKATDTSKIDFAQNMFVCITGFVYTGGAGAYYIALALLIYSGVCKKYVRLDVIYLAVFH